MWIKICANTNFEDAQLAATLGADALGFVFAASPRQVTADQVAAITARLPAEIEKIGVFDSCDPNEITSVAQAAGLTGIQLHGTFSPALIAGLVKRLVGLAGPFEPLAGGPIPGRRLIQTAHWQVSERVSDEDSSGANKDLKAILMELGQSANVDAVLVDSRTAAASGGTGISFDWEAAREALSSLRPKPLIVAGGLNSENVQDAVAVLRPWGVDVASGVEASPGKKDAAKLAAFLTNARKAAASGSPES